MNNLELEKMANEIRKDIVTAVHSAKSGHPGGSLSSADIFTYLYFEEMNVDPANPKWEDRDRFVLSKGHVAPGLYSTLAEKGYFPKEDLKTLRHTGSYLQGHPDMKHIPGIDMSSGSLGQGVSAAVGMAAAGKYDKKDYRVYTLTGDGEIQEGQIWEVDEYQIYQAKTLGAAAVLLICSILSEEQLGEYIKICDSLGISALVEIHNEKEAGMAVRAGARIIGVNNRNLKDFTVDTANSKKLRDLIPDDIIFVSESGVKSTDDIRAIREIGADAVLIGETLMRADDKKKKLDELRLS